MPNTTGETWGDLGMHKISTRQPNDEDRSDAPLQIEARWRQRGVAPPPRPAPSSGVRSCGGGGGVAMAAAIIVFASR